MKAPVFEYRRAATIGEAVRLLAELGEDAKVLAGGQSLGPMLNFRLVRPSHLLDVRPIAALREARMLGDGGVRLGAGVSHAAIEDGKVADPTGGLLVRVAGGIAHRAIRNRGTIGGSLAHADPAAEWPVVTSALGAVLRIASADGERAVAAREFFVGQLETVLKPGELLVAIEIAKPPPGAHCGFSKLARKSGEFADSLAAVVTRAGAHEEIEAADVWLGGAGGMPMRIATVETLLRGRRWNAETRALLPPAVAAALPDPPTPSARYKVNLHAVAIARALDDAHRRSAAA